ncbi:hypothetical protein CF386_08960 [Paraphotobacterium marinum]|uniref:Uncharacterized protein n=1 Tax=Paraphotobacterium marinum TaxID=1755811 RepID=A0A220VG16_9GAMM|nr:hypothetical protein CF386_08960 [Paraphotobacterium marinum]
MWMFPNKLRPTELIIGIKSYKKPHPHENLRQIRNEMNRIEKGIAKLYEKINFRKWTINIFIRYMYDLKRKGFKKHKRII